VEERVTIMLRALLLLASVLAVSAGAPDDVAGDARILLESSSGSGEVPDPSPSPSPPPPSPSSPPPSPSPPSPGIPPFADPEEYVIKMIVEGDIAEFDDDKCDEIAATTATLLEIDASQVTVTAKAGSVILTTTIVYDGEGDVDMEELYEENVGSGANVTALSESLGLTVTEVKKDKRGCGGGCVGGIVGGMSGCIFGVIGGMTWYREKYGPGWAQKSAGKEAELTTLDPQNKI